MTLVLRRVSRAVYWCAAVGVLAALWSAAREIGAHDYVRLGLWRTVLSIASRHTALGGAAGLAGGVLIMLSLLWGPKSLPSGIAQRLVVSFAMCAAAAVVFMPMDAPDLLGIQYWVAVAVCLVLLWFATREGAAGIVSPVGGGPRVDWFRLVWPLVVCLAYLVAVSHLWARAEAGWWMACVASGGLLAAIAVYLILYRHVERVIGLLGSTIETRPWVRHARWMPMAVLGGSLVLWSLGWTVARQARAHAKSAGLNVIIIAVDTLRLDGVSFFSEHEHDRDLTPNLRAFLTPRSTVFSNALSQAPWTLPAFASIFTGLYPEEHGAEHFASRLLPEQLTLAELLREAGYFTMGVVSGHFVGSEVGMSQGFAIFDESQAPGGTTITSANVTDRALAFLAAHQDRPFFLFVHYYDPHYVYRDHSEFRFGSGPATRRALDRARRLRRTQGRKGSGFVKSPRLRGYYDEEIAYTDIQIGRLLALLDQSELWDSTCVIFVADHGEEFLDHGSTGHVDTLFRELVHVPLAIADPSREAPATIAEPVETRWLFGTVLRAAGISPPGQGALASTLFAHDPEANPFLRSSTHPQRPVGEGGASLGTVHLSCVVDGQYKLIRDHVTRGVTLFDLQHDPAESRDVSALMPDRTGQLLAVLGRWDAELEEASPAARVRRLTEKEVERLKALGYL